MSSVSSHFYWLIFVSSHFYWPIFISSHFYWLIFISSHFYLPIFVSLDTRPEPFILTHICCSTGQPGGLPEGIAVVVTLGGSGAIRTAI